VIEDLSVQNMVRNHSLARAISDASWRIATPVGVQGRLVRQRGDRDRPLLPEQQDVLGAIVEKLPLNIREWTCPCGARHDRDVNAAKVIHAVGLAVSACEDGVRPARV